MPNVKGAVLTDCDCALLAYVGIARYASADQVHRLIAPDRSKKLVYRRLAKLCLPGGRPGEGACLRRLHYRRYEGTSVPVWALTPYGVSSSPQASPAPGPGERRRRPVPGAHAAPQRRPPRARPLAQAVRDGAARGLAARCFQPGSARRRPGRIG